MKNTEKRKIVESTIKILRKKGLLKEENETNNINSIKKVIKSFLQSSGGQDHAIINVNDILTGAREYFETENEDVSEKLLEIFIQDFEKNVIAKQSLLSLFQMNPDEGEDIDFEFEIVNPVSKLKGYKVKMPNGYNYFALYPSEHGDNDEIVICWFTEKGKMYAPYITGDY